jgi:hypothetical protein
VQARPGELVVVRLPGREGLYLGVQEEPNRMRTIARFSGDGEWSSRLFVEVLEAAGFRYRDKEEERGQLRSEAGEAGERPGVHGGTSAGPQGGREGPDRAAPEGRAA